MLDIIYLCELVLLIFLFLIKSKELSVNVIMKKIFKKLTKGLNN